MKVPPEIAEWGTWMRSEGLSTRTIKHRLETLTRFAREGLDVVAADSAAIAGFLAPYDWWSPSTRSNYYRALKAWYLWLIRRGIRPDNPLDLIKAPRQPRGRPRPTTTDQLAAILGTCNRRRTRAMALLAAYQGLRAHEIAKIRGEHVRNGKIKVLGKGSVEAELPLHPLVAEIAGSFPRIGWWFPSYTRPGHPITSQNVSAVLSQLIHRAGVDATGHQLRHWFGTETLKSSGGNLRTAQEALRHASVATTAIYTQIDDHEVREAIEGLPVPMYVVSGGKRRGRSAQFCTSRKSVQIPAPSERSEG